MERKTTTTFLALLHLVILCFVSLLGSACSGQPSLPAATAYPTQWPATPSPLPTNTPRPTNSPRPTTTSRPTLPATNTPVPPTVTMDLPQIQMATERGATAWAQTLFASLPQTATVIAKINQATRPAIAIPEAWVAARAVLPPDIPVYMPAYIPARFPTPEVFDLKVNEPLFGGPVYTIGYWLPTDKGVADTVVFILNNGSAGWGAVWTGPGITKKSITVDGESGELWMIPGENSSPALKGQTFYWASWKKQEQYCQVKAISSRMTEAEFMQIVHSVVQLKK